MKTMSASSRASFRERFLRYSVKTGTKETVSDPSARRRRRRFGIRKATKKASVVSPAPNRPATIMSRRKPKMRESIVAIPTTPAARTTFEFSEPLLSVMSSFPEIVYITAKCAMKPRPPPHPLPRQQRALSPCSIEVCPLMDNLRTIYGQFELHPHRSFRTNDNTDPWRVPLSFRRSLFLIL